jgi:hypothetical protein
MEIYGLDKKGIELRGSKASDLFKLIKVDKSIKTLVPFFPKKLTAMPKTLQNSLKLLYPAS